jgi:hypothetical protein
VQAPEAAVAASLPLPLSAGLRAAAKLFLLGVTLGTALDAVHTFTRTTFYTTPFAFGTPWWVPIEFGLAGIAVGLGRRLVERTFRAETAAPGAPVLAIGLAIFVLAYVASGLLSASAPLTAAVLGALFVVGWLVCDRTRVGLAAAAGTALVGVLVEIALIRAGVFGYTRPGLLGVANWLPLLYACAAVGIGNLGKHWSAAGGVGARPV